MDKTVWERVADNFRDMIAYGGSVIWRHPDPEGKIIEEFVTPSNVEMALTQHNIINGLVRGPTITGTHWVK